MLDRMSVAEGVSTTPRFIECARGTLLPDRSLPAQWMMFDLFEAMRTLDKPLADDLVRQTIDFFFAQVDGNGTQTMDLQTYFAYHDAAVGKGLLSDIMRFCAGLHMTADEMELINPVEENAMRHITFVNGIVSYEKKIMAAKAGFELGSIYSSVPIVREVAGVSKQEAKRVMWQMARAWEIRHFELVDGILGEQARPELTTYLTGLEHQIAGNKRWSLLTPRYNRTGGLGFVEGRL